MTRRAYVLHLRVRLISFIAVPNSKPCASQSSSICSGDAQLCQIRYPHHQSEPSSHKTRRFKGEWPRERTVHILSPKRCLSSTRSIRLGTRAPFCYQRTGAGSQTHRGAQSGRRVMDHAGYGRNAAEEPSKGPIQLHLPHHAVPQPQPSLLHPSRNFPITQPHPPRPVRESIDHPDAFPWHADVAARVAALRQSVDNPPTRTGEFAPTSDDRDRR